MENKHQSDKNTFEDMIWFWSTAEKLCLDLWIMVCNRNTRPNNWAMNPNETQSFEYITEYSKCVTIQRFSCMTLYTFYLIKFTSLFTALFIYFGLTSFLQQFFFVFQGPDDDSEDVSWSRISASGAQCWAALKSRIRPVHRLYWALIFNPKP